MRAVRIGEVARDEHDLGPVLLEQLERDLDVSLADRVLAHLAGLIEGQIQEARLRRAHAERLDAETASASRIARFRTQDVVGIHVAGLLRLEELLDPADQRRERSPCRSSEVVPQRRRKSR